MRNMPPQGQRIRLVQRARTPHRSLAPQRQVGVLLPPLSVSVLQPNDENGGKND